MTRLILGKSLLKFTSTLVVAALLLFLPAGTVHYSNGWLLLALLFVPMAVLGVVLLVKNPELLRRRLDTKETEREQVKVTRWTGALIIAGLISAGLDFRFGWSIVPGWAVTAASVAFIGGYGLWVIVLVANPFLGRTIGVEEEQYLIDSGPYRYVRHPMYTASNILFLALPLVLGSSVSLVIFLFYPMLMVYRISGEERYLIDQLAGYEQYCKRVRHRLIPFIW